MSREMLTFEFRFDRLNSNKDDREYTTHTITIGIYDTIDEAIEAGNVILEKMSNKFEIRENDKFTKNGLFGIPNRLVSNCCYTSKSKGISYYGKITKLDETNIFEYIDKAFENRENYINWKIKQQNKED